MDSPQVLAYDWRDGAVVASVPYEAQNPALLSTIMCNHMPAPLDRNRKYQGTRVAVELRSIAPGETRTVNYTLAFANGPGLSKNLTWDDQLPSPIR